MLSSNSGEAQSSVNKFEQMLKTSLTYFFDAQEFENIIIHYLSIGENQLARKALKIGLEQHPTCHALILLQSEILILEEKFETALQILEYLEKLNPFDEEIELQKATIASKRGDHKTSIKHLNVALEISEDPYNIWNLLGMEHLLAEEFEQASCFFGNCLNENPDDYPSLYNLLYCFEQLNKQEAAINSLNKVLEYNPYCEVAWQQLGKILIKLGRIDEAVSALDFAIISDDSFTGAYIEKGKLLETLGKINEAIENYEVALSTAEPNAFIYKCIGRCHEGLGNFDLALQFYLKSIQLEPSNEKSWESLILFFVSQKKYKKAKIYLEHAIEINNDSIELWKNSIEVYTSMNLKNKALASNKKLLELGYNDPDLQLHLIDFFLEKKQWKEAHKIAKQAFISFPENRSLAVRIAGCCLHLQQRDEGIYMLNPKNLNLFEKEQFLKLFPDFECLLPKN